MQDVAIENNVDMLLFPLVVIVANMAFLINGSNICLKYTYMSNPRLTYTDVSVEVERGYGRTNDHGLISRNL